MNANLNNTSYRMHELTRDSAMQAADAHRLAFEATGVESLTVHSLMARRSLRIAIALLIAVVLLALGTQASNAQALTDPGTTEAYHPALVSFRMGIYYQSSGQHSQAIEAFSETIDAFPMVAAAWAARADSYFALGEYALAIVDYTEAVAIASDFVSALNMRADAYQLIGAFELAVADYQNAIAQMPEYAAPHAGLAAAYNMLGQLDEAQAEHAVYLRLVGPNAAMEDEASA